MRLWRLSRHASLDGSGGIKVSGRWHTAGRPVLYCAPNPATALLEQLVHQQIRRPEALQGYRLLEIEVRPSLRSVRMELGDLPQRWIETPALTRRLGDDWLRAGDVPLLLVPCAIIPATHNVLIDVTHPDAGRIELVTDRMFVFDPRLIA